VHSVVHHSMFLHHVRLCTSVLTSGEVICRHFVGGYRVLLNSRSLGGHQIFGIGSIRGHDIGCAGKLDGLYCGRGWC
jgi:hypothetical protein